jgi:hypothetical protein
VLLPPGRGRSVQVLRVRVPGRCGFAKGARRVFFGIKVASGAPFMRKTPLAPLAGGFSGRTDPIFRALSDLPVSVCVTPPFYTYLTAFPWARKVGHMTKKKSGKRAGRSPRCRTCGKVIRVPKGWSVGSASRRHYWREHRDVMQPRTLKESS